MVAPMSTRRSSVGVGVVGSKKQFGVILALSTLNHILKCLKAGFKLILNRRWPYNGGRNDLFYILIIMRPLLWWLLLPFEVLFGCQ